MKRFITYVYVYENGTKGKNAGFIKVEIRDGKVRMEMQIRNLGRYQGKAEVYLMVPDQNNETGIAISIGEIEVRYGAGKMIYELQETGIAASNYDFSQVAGMWMKIDAEHELASCWVERADYIVMSGCKKLVQEEQVGIEERASYIETKFESNRGEQDKNGSSIDRIRRGQDENRKRIDGIKRGQDENRSSIDRIRNGQEGNKCDLDEKESGIARSERTQEVTSNDLERTNTITLRKIDIKEIHSFPKQNWYLCNNSFLIHGFFNYHYLMLKKVTDGEQTKYYLGVPGIYDKPERMMALLFGFPEFEKAEGNSSDVAQGAVSELSVNHGVAGRADAEQPANPRVVARPTAEQSCAHPSPAQQSFGYWYCLLDM